jgi:putative oxidoreductase
MTAMTRNATARRSGVLEHIAALRRLLARFPLAAIELAMRAGVGAVFFKSGLTKIASWDSTIALFENEYALPLLPPELAAAMAATCELAGPVLLVLGFGARFGAAALLGMTVVIQVLVYPENWAEHLLWASAFAYVLTRGAGALSLDHLIARRLFRA